MKAIIDTRVNVFIIILLVIKKLQMMMKVSDGSKIIAIDQIKKNVIKIVRNAPLSIQDVRISISLLVINILENNLFLKMD